MPSREIDNTDVQVDIIEDAAELSERFSPYGEIVDLSAAPERILDGGRLCIRQVPFEVARTENDARLSMDVYEIKSRHLPLEIKRLERHPFSFQTFIPLSPCTLIVAVCPPRLDGEPNFPALSAFLIEAGRIITYRQGVWHMGATCIRGDARLAMMMYKSGRGDTDFRDLGESLRLRL